MDKSESDSKQNNTTVLQSTATGVVGGAAEVCVNHPFWSLKKSRQARQAFTLNPEILYRGFLANLLSMVPITAIQVGLGRVVQKYVMDDSKPLSNAQKMASAAAGGAGSALVGCPAELLMTHQSNTGKSFSATMTHLYKSDGVRGLYKSLVPTAVRDGVYSGAAFGAGPILKEQFKQHGLDDKKATLAAGVSAGVGAAVLTHAVDTVKTVQQNVEPDLAKGFFETAGLVVADKGLKSLSAGLLYRGMRVVSGVTILGKVKEEMDSYFTEQNRYQNKKRSL